MICSLTMKISRFAPACHGKGVRLAAMVVMPLAAQAAA
jgi:hypothetical protein